MQTFCEHYAKYSIAQEIRLNICRLQKLNEITLVDCISAASYFAGDNMHSVTFVLHGLPEMQSFQQSLLLQVM